MNSKITSIVYYSLVALLAHSCNTSIRYGTDHNASFGGTPENPAPVQPGLPENPGQTSSIDTNNKASVIKAMNEIYRAPTPEMKFTGDVANCIEGTTSIEYQQAVINRINFYRAMTGLNPVTLNLSNSSYQKAALMMSANGQLSHSPPTSWKCYTPEGAGGAGGSNLALGADGVWAISIYIDDFGSNNYPVGHRRWILGSMQSSIATGDVPGANSLGVNFGGGGAFPGGRQFTSWPSSGYFPTELLPASSRRWSISMNNVGFGEAVVTMKNVTTGEYYNVTKEPLHSGYGDNTLVWVPAGIQSNASADTTILITISNLNSEQQSLKTVSYTVTLFQM